MEKIKVGVVGYGTIGKRIADAVILQPDMELVGVTAHSYNYRIDIAQEKGIPVFYLEEKNGLEKNCKLAGNLKALVNKCDVVVDCSPSPCGAENKAVYEELGVKAIFQGGEKSEVAQTSFVAQCNYEKSINKDYVRVVSCNTTGLSRSLKILDDLYGVTKVNATLIRRATDPGQVNKGPINAIVPTMELPSHHGPDVLTILPHIDVFTMAVVVPTTIMHMHNISAKVTKTPDLEEIKKKFKSTPRLRVVSAKEKITSTAHLAELGRDLGYSRGDMMDICLWEEGIAVKDNEVFFMQAVHQESDVIPENIDAIRAMMGMKDADMSMEITNTSLGLMNGKKKSKIQKTEVEPEKGLI